MRHTRVSGQAGPDPVVVLRAPSRRWRKRADRSMTGASRGPGSSLLLAVSLARTSLVMRQIAKRLGRWSRPRNGQGRCETAGVYALLVRGVLYGPGSQQECTAALRRLPAEVMRAEMAVSSFLIANRQVLRRRPLVELAAVQRPAAGCGRSGAEEA